MPDPLAIDLFCGLGGWSESLLSLGYRVVGYDIEAREHGEHRYPGELVIQDVLTIHGAQFNDAALIVASPPCQEYSYMAMPWARAKAKAAAIRADTTGAELERLNRLFDACFRIQKEALVAAGRHVPLVVENVRGAIPWVGRSRWNFGSFHLWGDVPALMPSAFTAKRPGHDWNRFKETGEVSPSWWADGQDSIAGCARFDGSGQSFQTASGSTGMKVASETGRRTDIGNGARFTSRDCGAEGIKVGGSGREWFAGEGKPGRLSSKSPARKAASALIAKIPAPLALHIGQVYWPREQHA